MCLRRTCDFVGVASVSFGFTFSFRFLIYQPSLHYTAIANLNPLYPVDVYTRHKFWCTYNTVDVYTRHSHRLLLCTLFTWEQDGGATLAAR